MTPTAPRARFRQRAGRRRKRRNCTSASVSRACAPTHGLMRCARALPGCCCAKACDAAACCNTLGRGSCTTETILHWSRATRRDNYDLRIVPMSHLLCFGCVEGRVRRCCSALVCCRLVRQRAESICPRARIRTVLDTAAPRTELLIIIAWHAYGAKQQGIWCQLAVLPAATPGRARYC